MSRRRERPGDSHYSLLHRLDSPANRRVRETIWEPGDDIGQQSFITPRYLDEMARRIEIGPRMRVLDIGSGPGGPAVHIASTTGCAVTGIDVNRVGVGVARDLAEAAGVGERVEFHIGDAMAMPFADGAFDAAISVNVLNVFEDKTALFREIRRVLRPEGRLAFISGTFRLDEADEPARRAIVRDDRTPVWLDSAEDYRAKLADAGFAIIEITEYVADFRVQIARWGEAYRTHRDAVAAEQGEEAADSHVAYYRAYLGLIDAGKASNHLFVAAPA